jgi:DNA-binding HxlR family transcriptional regulator
MTRTHEKVRHLPGRKHQEHTPVSAAEGVERALKILDGRWKFIILFHLFGRADSWTNADHRHRQAILRMSLPRLPPLNSPMNAV